MNILLVEPDYKNKYPPIGLMKIATYHESKGDTVRFVKGTENIPMKFDRIYVTSLFTFYFDITVKTINYYSKHFDSDVFVGGIMASIMPDKLKSEISNKVQVITGQLIDSCILGFDDQVNIDLLPLDYRILYQTEYEYASAKDGYISYTTRGCTNRCAFCAVPKLEPHFMIANNLTNQVNEAIENNGPKKNLLLLDNNILSLSDENLVQVVEQVYDLGFGRGSTYIGELLIEQKYRELEYLHTLKGTLKVEKEKCLNDMANYIIESKNSKQKKNKFGYVGNLVEAYHRYDANILENYLLDNKEQIVSIFKKLERRRGQIRSVDFNQGMDARQLTEEKMQILSRINIVPFRLALDDVRTIEVYVESIKRAVRYGVKVFSNYLLYNFHDTPQDMYTRLRLNLKLANELGVNIYSFPMKYADINSTDRKNVGKNWPKYYLTNFRRILKPTSGVVGRGESYFNVAFGHNIEEFLEILSMPYDFVTFRNEFKDSGLTQQWKDEWRNLSNQEKTTILNELSNSNYDYEHEIMRFYKITQKSLHK